MSYLKYSVNILSTGGGCRVAHWEQETSTLVLYGILYKAEVTLEHLGCSSGANSTTAICTYLNIYTLICELCTQNI